CDARAPTHDEPDAREPAAECAADQQIQEQTNAHLFAKRVVVQKIRNLALLHAERCDEQCERSAHCGANPQRLQRAAERKRPAFPALQLALIEPSTTRRDTEVRGSHSDRGEGTKTARL